MLTLASCFSIESGPDISEMTEAELVAHVIATPGAIGYVDADTPHDGAKVLVIDP